MRRGASATTGSERSICCSQPCGCRRSRGPRRSYGSGSPPGTAVRRWRMWSPDRETRWDLRTPRHSRRSASTSTRSAAGPKTPSGTARWTPLQPTPAPAQAALRAAATPGEQGQLGRPVRGAGAVGTHPFHRPSEEGSGVVAEGGRRPQGAAHRCRAHRARTAARGRQDLSGAVPATGGRPRGDEGSRRRRSALCGVTLPGAGLSAGSAGSPGTGPDTRTTSRSCRVSLWIPGSSGQEPQDSGVIFSST